MDDIVHLKQRKIFSSFFLKFCWNKGVSTRSKFLTLGSTSANMSELAVCKLDDVQHILWFDYWYQLAGNCTRHLCVNVIGYTLLAQRLHMLHVGK